MKTVELPLELTREYQLDYDADPYVVLTKKVEQLSELLGITEQDAEQLILH